MTASPEILIVDDQPVNLDVLREILEAQHYTVRVMTSGELALRSIQAFPPDLILLDIMMPGLNGFEVCRRLKQDPCTHDIPIIFISALDSADDKVEAFAVGGVDYVAKPFQHAEVLARVRTHLAMHRLQIDLQVQIAETQHWADTLEEQVQARTQELAQALHNEQSLRSQLIQEAKLAAMGRMVASIAHELNNPLQIIRNALYLIKGRVNADQRAETYFDLSLSEIDRLSNLVTQLRQVYRPGTYMQAEPVNLAEVLHGLELLLEPHLKHHQVTLQSVALDDCLRVSGNPDQLKQVLLNLCLNAIDAMKPDGGVLRIYLLLTTDGSQVGIAVQDSGQGIAEEDIQAIFDPFYSTKEQGSGLGLAISYDIVQKHNGRMEVQSRVGQGTTFLVWLPLLPMEDE